MNTLMDQAPQNLNLDAALVITRLEEAGATMMALPGTGYSTKIRISHLDVLHDAVEAYGWDRGRIRPAVPPAARQRLRHWRAPI